ncbi:MAG TPA: DNA helicase UvrD, partial [Desulfonauticus sp.]|nr:DNA helicase UvrD [Desulfonauticus sp.]
MDRFIADLHIHSPFSRATSKKLLPRNLAAWAEIKGLDVVATGDFTHPKWLEILEEELVEVEEGLFELKNKQGLTKEIPGFSGELKGKVRFILSAEISSIYKKRGKVRKIHNLVYVPSLDKAKELNRKLAEIGNLHSDGRPILGLDAKDLLDMVLELDSKAFLVPAHIWTPWFSLFGSKSGFDSIEECFEDLSKYIFALETGLSSDPEMNWLLSKLDRFFLVSNSDAHSGENLAREANIFQGEVSYTGVYYALRGEGLSHKFLGTLEFYPEEGKYHLDGHRKCKVVLTPQETLSRGGICP